MGELLQRVPDDYKPLAAVIVGAIILVAIVLVHGSGLHSIMVGQDRWKARLFAHHPHLTGAALIFGWGVFLMLFLQIAEILIWSLLLSRLGLIKNIHDDIYFCANAYTTLGMGKMELESAMASHQPHHRHLRPLYFRLDHQCAGRYGCRSSADR